MNSQCKYLVIVIVTLMGGVYFLPGISSSQSSVETLKKDGKASAQNKPTPEPNQIKEPNNKIIEQIDTKKNPADELKRKKEEIKKAKEESEKAIQEKKRLEKEVLKKEKKIKVNKEEKKVLEGELSLKKDSAAIVKLEKLREETTGLEKQLESSKSKLTVVDQKAEIAQKSILDNKEAIESLRNELANLKREKAASRDLSEKLIDVGLIFLISLILWGIKKIAIRKFDEIISQKDAIRESDLVLRLKTISSILKWLLAIIIVGIAVYMTFEAFGIDMTPFLAGAGIVGLAIGFGGQYLIRDIINGLFILLENQYNVEDVIKVGEFGGLVEGINLRYTRLRDLEGRVIYIPNGEIKVVINFTKEFSRAVLDIGVAYKENVDEVMKVIKDVGLEMRQDPYFQQIILEDLEMMGLNEFGESQITIRCRIKTKPIKQWEVAREFRRRLKIRFDELGIEIPFPHRTLYVGSGTDNEWLKKIAQQRKD